MNRADAQRLLDRLENGLLTLTERQELVELAAKIFRAALDCNSGQAIFDLNRMVALPAGHYETEGQT